MIHELKTAYRKWHADLHAKMAAVAAADAELAALGIRELSAGIVDETPEFVRLNRVSDDASCAVPFLFRGYADWLSFKANGEAWQRVADLEAALVLADDDEDDEDDDESVAGKAHP